MSGEPEDWGAFRLRVDAMFGGEQPEEDAEALVLATWAASPSATWAAALSVSTDVVSGGAAHGWRVLAHRCKVSIAPAAAVSRRNSYVNAPSGQTELPPARSVERRRAILYETGAYAMLEKLRRGGNYTPPTRAEIEEWRNPSFEVPDDPGPEP